ncbi:hypothetical protein B0H13DRAFT_2323368 [Mycena leptocephala]|nr:hypothetical protein B0H13DRAFT_2323368 [Mycena leptocephala]
MTHILTECKENGQEQVWDLASELWSQKTKQPLRPLIGEIMGWCDQSGNKPGSVDKGTSRLYRIIVSDSAHLIWRLRNERRMQGRDPASEHDSRDLPEMETGHEYQAGTRLPNDKQNLLQKESGPKVTCAQNLQQVIQDEDTLPADWTGEPQVLVGVG